MGKQERRVKTELTPAERKAELARHLMLARVQDAARQAEVFEASRDPRES